MEKSIIKKNVHLSEKEKQYVARLIQDGGTLEDISKWHKTRFGKPIARSKYYRLKSQVSSIHYIHISNFIQHVFLKLFIFK